jgi:hypothetical protein
MATSPKEKPVVVRGKGEASLRFNGSTGSTGSTVHQVQRFDLAISVAANHLNQLNL